MGQCRQGRGRGEGALDPIVDLSGAGDRIHLNCSSLEPRREPTKGRLAFEGPVHVAYGSFNIGRRPGHRLASLPASGTAALVAGAGLGALLFVVFACDGLDERLYAVASRAGEPAQGAGATPLSLVLVAVLGAAGLGLYAVGRCEPQGEPFKAWTGRGATSWPLHPGPLRWLRSLGWGGLLFVVFSVLYWG
jgi:hypothetical protein